MFESLSDYMAAVRPRLEERDTVVDGSRVREAKWDSASIRRNGVAIGCHRASQRLADVVRREVTLNAAACGGLQKHSTAHMELHNRTFCLKCLCKPMKSLVLGRGLID